MRAHRAYRVFLVDHRLLPLSPATAIAARTGAAVSFAQPDGRRVARIR